MPKQSIRVETSGSQIGDGCKVFLVQEEGDDIDISNITYGVDVSIRVGEPNRVTCHMYYPYGEFEGELEDVVLDVIPPTRIPEVIHRLIKKVQSLEEQTSE